MWERLLLYAEIKSSNFYFDSMVDLCYLSGSLKGKFKALKWSWDEFILFTRVHIFFKFAPNFIMMKIKRPVLCSSRITIEVMNKFIRMLCEGKRLDSRISLNTWNYLLLKLSNYFKNSSGKLRRRSLLCVPVSRSVLRIGRTRVTLSYTHLHSTFWAQEFDSH